MDGRQDPEHAYGEEACPFCGHWPTVWMHCHAMGCDDGYVDLHEFDDPLFYDPGDVAPCDECDGTGIIEWCPVCGRDPREAEAES